jgi:phosphatidylinositol kinase/protein kinase (PI-3  family)
MRDLNQAWDLYYHVFRRISRQLPQLTSLELQYVSPRLLNCRDLELAVPGSYVPDNDLIRIAHIQSSLQVTTLRVKKTLINNTIDTGSTSQKQTKKSMFYVLQLRPKFNYTFSI